MPGLCGDPRLQSADTLTGAEEVAGLGFSHQWKMTSIVTARPTVVSMSPRSANSAHSAAAVQQSLRAEPGPRLSTDAG
jgi:hypothetical protein